MAVTYDQLKTLTNDEPQFRERVKMLGPLIDRRLASLSNAIREYQVNGYKITPNLMASRQANRVMMDSIRQFLADMQEQERLMVKSRDGNLAGFYTTTSLVTVVSLIIALITIVYSVYVYNRENKAKETAITNARNYGQQLEERVKELDRVNLELQELKSMEKFVATGRIARTIAHEVRNPLTNISLASEQIKEITGNQEEAEVLLDMIGRNVNRINQLVSDLLNSTRFAQLEFDDVYINELLDEAIGFASDRIELKEVKVTKDYARDLCQIHVDKEKIKIAFLNIIVNAIEAMETGRGLLELRTRKVGNKCQVEIRDNGIGMNEETQARLFEPYFTAKKKEMVWGLPTRRTSSLITRVILKFAVSRGWVPHLSLR
ncbi:MAG: ATP-binding protein [Chitinophagaceae bacterium]|nr:ATP-binding protein [Chitinophagaceae bacterium]